MEPAVAAEPYVQRRRARAPVVLQRLWERRRACFAGAA